MDCDGTERSRNFYSSTLYPRAFSTRSVGNSGVAPDLINLATVSSLLVPLDITPNQGLLLLIEQAGLD